ncbi:hypothetical protein F4779DRAFT_318429 [Xylariaceae sp. FL0662B]|nr:hypothetical protein F4779DRAFT_318429 [Xylariaceae sp. FL0662B]
MANILDLPNEILIAILEHLAIVDLQTLVLSQFTDRRLHELGQDVISNIQRNMNDDIKVVNEQPSIHPLLRAKFKPLFNSADCFTEDEKRQYAFLSLNGDYVLPFCRLPWARSESDRSAFIRPDASWRNISLTFGQPPITHLDIVKSYSTSRGDSVDYYEVELPSSGLTMGIFYDLLLDEDATYGNETGSWELLLGLKLRSYDVLFEYECFIPTDQELVVSGREARQAAVLYVRGNNECDSTGPGVDGNDWILSTSDRSKPRLLPWQGPKPNLVYTMYPDFF